MKKLNLVTLELPCTSLDQVLRVSRTLALDKAINDARNDYRLKNGCYPEVVTSYMANDNKVFMSLYQVPPPEAPKAKAFVINHEKG